MKQTPYGNIYEDLSDLLSEQIVFAAEDDRYYYIKVKPKSEYENAIWKVDKKTRRAAYMLYTAFLQIEDETKKINPQKLRRISK